MFKEQVKKIAGWIIYLKETKSVKKDLDIFLFHEITNNPSKFQKNHKIFHNINDFKQIIDWISANYKIISPLEINNLKKKSALITFDDGYAGAFKNAVPYLIKNKIPSLHFLNMKPIINREPNIVSKIEYLKKNNKTFQSYLNKKKMIFPIYDMNPDKFKNFDNKMFIDSKKVIRYQGELVNSITLKKYSNNDFVFYGNHLYDHWNVINLDMKEIKKLYFQNKKYLKNYSNFIDIFSFTHGVPNKNFSKKNLNQLLSFKPKHIFYSSGGNKKYNMKTFDRTFLTVEELNNKIFYFRKFRSKFLF